MRVLVITSVFPNQRTPGAAPFMLRQCRALGELCELRVVAPLPWFPAASWLSRHTYWGADLARVPREERIEGVRVVHPRWLHVPRWSLPNATTYAASLYRIVKKLEPFDAILTTWAYPDGVACLRLGERFRVPVVLQVIGSDLDVVAKIPSARRQLRSVLPRARGVVAVSRPLAEECRRLGARSERVHHVVTGVDRELFRPRERAQAFAELGLDEGTRWLLFVGRLSRAKGLLDLLRAFERLAATKSELRLAVIGDGPLASTLDDEARSSGGRVRALGSLAPDEVARWLAAARGLVLPSYHEGTPNVVLEALSSGRPVLGTSVGGMTDLLSDPRAGVLVPPGDVPALSRGLEKLLDTDYSAEQILGAVELNSWHDNAERLLGILQGARADEFETIGGGESSKSR